VANGGGLEEVRPLLRWVHWVIPLRANRLLVLILLSFDLADVGLDHKSRN
jgi:hypothetical protein